MSQPVNVSTGMGPLGILWIAFIIMKVLHYIDWSWYVVFLWPVPVWMLLVAVFLLVVSFCSYKGIGIN